MMMPVDYKKEVSVVLQPNKMVPEPLHHKIAPVLNTVRILDDAQVTTHVDAVKIVADELLDADSNLALMLNYVESAPEDCKIIVDPKSVKEAEEKGKLLIVKTPSFRAPSSKNISVGSSIAMYNALCAGGFSASCAGNAFLLRHVYGVRFRADMMKYISFLTDFHIAEGITTIHLHNKDTKYAIGLMNMYPKLKVVVKGTGTVKDAGLLSIATKNDMYKSCKLDNVIGVFIKARKYSKPEKKADICEYAQIQDQPVREMVCQYKNYFRYMDPRAMMKDGKYRQTINTASNLCIESNIGPCHNYDTMWYRMAVALMHRQLLPWHLKPLVNTYPDWYPALHPRYSFIATKNIVEAIEISGFMSFTQESNDADFIQYINEAREGDTIAAGQRKGYARDHAKAKNAIVNKRDGSSSRNISNNKNNNNNRNNYNNNSRRDDYDDDSDDDSRDLPENRNYKKIDRQRDKRRSVSRERKDVDDKLTRGASVKGANVNDRNLQRGRNVSDVAEEKNIKNVNSARRSPVSKREKQKEYCEDDDDDENYDNDDEDEEDQDDGVDSFFNN